MFENLIESRRRRQRPRSPDRGLPRSCTWLLIYGAVKATRVRPSRSRTSLRTPRWCSSRPPKPPPPPRAPPENAIVSANPPPQGFQTVMPPTEIPTEIPPVNLNERFDPKDFTGKGVEGGIAAGVAGGTGPVPIEAGEVFLAAEVERRPPVDRHSESRRGIRRRHAGGRHPRQGHGCSSWWTRPVTVEPAVIQGGQQHQHGVRGAGPRGILLMRHLQARPRPTARPVRVLVQQIIIVQGTVE